MKNLHFISASMIVIGMMLVACSEDSFETELDSPIANESLRSIDEIIRIAEQGIDILESNQATRSPHFRRTISRDRVCAISTNTTRSGDNTPLLYAVNFDNNEGYAIVSAKKSAIGLLAVTESGEYEPATADDNGFGLFIELADYYVRTIPELNPTPFIIITTTSTCGPYVKVKWGQQWPTGILCPNGIAGCANTAVIQAMTYYEYPTSINLTYPEAQVSNLTLHWDDIKKHEFGSNQSSCLNHTNPWCLASEEAHDEISMLCREIGYLNCTTYYWNRSGTRPNNVPNALRTFGYDVPDLMPFSSTCLATPLSNGKVVIMGGCDQDSGHCWLVDGYVCQDRLLADYDIEGNQIHDITYYNHINWGWNGINDGYFLDTVFNADGSVASDSLSMTTGLNFSYDIQYSPISRN